MAAKFIDFAEIKDLHSMLDVAEMLGLELKQEGKQYRTACPAHGENDRGMVITPSQGDDGAFYCFKTKRGGRDCISLVAHIRECGQNEAAHWIAEQSGKTGKGNSTSTSNGTVSRKGTSSQSEEGKEPEGTATRAINPLNHLEYEAPELEQFEILPETCEELGCGLVKKGLLIRAGGARFAVPVHTRDGKLVAYCGVAVKEGQNPRFYFPPGFDPNPYLFNAHQVEGEDILYVAQDPVTAISAIQNGVVNAVSFFGTVTTDSLDALQILMDERSIASVEFI